ERRGLAGAAETAATRRRPRQGVPLPIGDRDDRVVERGVNVRDRVENVLARLLRLLAAARGGCARGATRSLCFLISHAVTLALCLARRRVELDRLLARTLAGTSVGARTLATDRQAAPMAHAAVRAQVHEALDVHGHLATQVTLDGKLLDQRADRVDLGLGEILHLGLLVDASRDAQVAGARATHTVDVSQSDAQVLVHRDVDTGNTCHFL